MLQLLKYTSLIIAALLSLLSDWEKMREDGKKRIGIVTILIAASCLLAMLTQYEDDQTKKIEADSTRARSSILQNKLGRLVDSASTTSGRLSQLFSSQQDQLWESYRPLYPIKEFSITFLLIYFFEKDDSNSKSFFERLPGNDPETYQLSENSDFYPYPSHKSESNLRQLLHNPNLRLEFTLPGHQKPSLVYTNNRNFELFKYMALKVNGERRIQCNVNFNNRKIWVADGSIISIIDLIGSTLTLRFDALSPLGTFVQGITFSLNDMQNIDPMLANNKHQMPLKEKDKTTLPGYDNQPEVLAYRKVITAADLGLPDIRQSIH